MTIIVALVWNVFIIAFALGDFPIEVTDMMDQSIHPCDDFYKYSCGGWLRDTTLKLTDVQLDASMDLIRDHNNRIIDHILEAKHPILSELWDSCLHNELMIDNKPLQHDLHRLSSAATIKDVVALAGEFARTGTNTFIQFTVAPDSEDATMNTLQVSAKGLVSPASSRDQAVKISKMYREYITNLIKLSGYPTSHEESVADIVIEMAETLTSVRILFTSTTVQLSLKEAIKSWPMTIGVFSEGLGMKESTLNEKISIHGPQYMDYVEKMLHHLPLHALKLYVAFAMIDTRAQWLGPDFYHVWFKFYRQELNGQQQPRDRRTVCKDNLLQYVPDLIGTYYSKNAFDKERKHHVLEMVQLIKRAMGNHIDSSDWLRGKDADEAQQKLNKLVSLIGQPTVPRSYPTIMLRNNYYANIHRILSHSFDVEMKKVGQRVNREEWSLSSATANAYYKPTHNSIVFPAGILQPPHFYQSSVHPALNFGAIGTTIGHELTHAFDTRGSNYDGDGNLRPWWTDSTAEKFHNLTLCFKKQYTTFKVDGEHGVIGNVRGNLTLDENIADNGGVALAWDAYRKYVTKLGPEINGIKSDKGDQLFFIVYGQSMCDKTRDELMLHLLDQDLHAPSQWRVNGVVMNNERFAEVFQCKPDAPMNPLDKCKLW